MNMWNRDFVHANYPRQVKAFLIEGPDGTLSVPSAPAREVMGQPVITDTCDFGWTAVWAAEMGDTETLHGMLRHADRFMNPTWRDAGLYYPRNDALADAHGHRVEVEPMTGNVLLGLPGGGTVTISRVAGRGRWAVEADGQVVAKIENNSAERGHEPPPLTVHVAGEEVLLRCDEQPRLFTLRPEP